MDKEERLKQINNELKVYINESSFISQRCRNKLLKMFENEFLVSLDIGSYKNVDLKILDDYQILYREDTYESREKITSLEELETRYKSFQEKADVLIRRRNVDFQGRRNFNNFTNLVVIACIFLLMIAMIVLGVHAFFAERYLDCLWLIIVIFPWVFPKLKDNLHNRMLQAKQYIKSLLKKVK